MARVSIVIPCYNQGEFLDEAVDSALAQTYGELEVIVVNDGSTDPFTNQLLGQYRRERTRVVSTTNQGLAAARNNGIAEATGTFILPLDADDRLAPGYVEEAVAVLESEPEVGIVYCRATLFGAVETVWQLPRFSINEMLRDNVIFCSALFRRSDWELVGGYDPGMIYGWEDYDFWLSLIERGRQVRQLDQYGFYYRVTSDSMVRSRQKWQKVEMFKRIFNRHQKLFGDHIEVWLEELIETREPYHLARLYVDCGAGVSDADSLAFKVGTGRTILHFDLRKFKGRRALRFDPAEGPVSLEFNRIRCSSGETSWELERKRLGANTDFRYGNRLLFEGADPQLFLGLGPDQVSKLDQLSLELDYRAFGTEALRELVIELAGSRKSDRPFGLLSRLLRR